MWQEIWQTASDLSVWEWSAFTAGLIYVYLASKNKISCWFFGILSSGIWTYVSYFEYQLYMDSALNVFYVIMGAIGWLNWSKSGDNPRISNYSLSFHATAICFLLVLSSALAYLLDHKTNADLPYWDAGTTIFSIWATYLLIKHKRENWLYWILTDFIYVGLYAYKGAYLFSILFVVYTVISIQGWYAWSPRARYVE